MSGAQSTVAGAPENRGGEGGEHGEHGEQGDGNAANERPSVCSVRHT